MLKLWRDLTKGFDWLESVFSYITGLMYVTVMLITCYDVIMRYIFNSPTHWVSDVSGYILVYSLFFGAGWLLREDGHVKIEFVFEHLSVKIQRILNFLIYIIISLSCLLLMWLGLELAWDAYSKGITLWRGIVVPKHILYWPVAFGSFLLFIESVRKVKKHMREEKGTAEGKGETWSGGLA